MMLIAGPCSAESLPQMMETARGLAGCGVSVFRAGLWKPRSHPGSFEGVGAEGLPWLQEVRAETGMKVATEVAGASHVEACLSAGIDLLWIGARTTTNPFLMQEIAAALEGVDIPVYIKNPVTPDGELWAGAVERFQKSGVRRIGLILRGFTTPESGPYRNAPVWPLAIGMRTRFPQLPMLVDPSHIAGNRERIPLLCQQTLDLGLDGLMVEVHCNPAAALSDAAQQLTPDDFRALLGNLRQRSGDSSEGSWRAEIEAFRAEIDDIDARLLELLSSRMQISRQIGGSKRSHGVAILQTGRWEALLSDMIARGREAGLSEEFIRRVFSAIHDESIRVQES